MAGQKFDKLLPGQSDCCRIAERMDIYNRWLRQSGIDDDFYLASTIIKGSQRRYRARCDAQHAFHILRLPEAHFLAPDNRWQCL